MPMRVYPDPSAEGRVGIGRDGEIFETEDAERLIGQGIVTHTNPRPRKRPKKEQPASPPAKEA